MLVGKQGGNALFYNISVKLKKEGSQWQIPFFWKNVHPCSRATMTYIEESIPRESYSGGSWWISILLNYVGFHLTLFNLTTAAVVH